MLVVRALILLGCLAGAARAQIGTPTPCGDASVEQERFRPSHGRVRYHLRFQAPDGTVDARVVLTMPHRSEGTASCTEGDAVDFLLGELAKERKQFLP